MLLCEDFHGEWYNRIGEVERISSGTLTRTFWHSVHRGPNANHCTEIFVYSGETVPLRAQGVLGPQAKTTLALTWKDKEYSGEVHEDGKFGQESYLVWSDGNTEL